MTINMYQDEFGRKLAEVVSPSQPIRRSEYLQGRDDELADIKRALYAPGRHVFIYGFRGVGKSSLAATAAYQYDDEPIFVSGSVDDDFKSVIANVANVALGRSRTEAVKKQRSGGLELPALKLGKATEISAIDIASQIRSTGDACELLKQVAARHSSKPIVVLDEFDTITDPSERAKFAALLKLLGDQSVNIKFIITGVGRSLDELLGAHQSAYRQLHTRELAKLDWEARRQIVLRAVHAFNLGVNDNVNWRIAMVSDGFPHYVHLITEKMLWEAFEDPDLGDQVTWPHYHRGLKAAIRSINAELKRPYEQAVVHRTPEYEDVVWATADGEDLFRSLPAMHESYLRIADKRQVEQPLDRKKFSELVRKLKTEACGEVLEPVAGRQGWYEYKEKMLRGYVRMQAEANGIELSGEKPLPKQQMRIPNARTGAFGSSIPRGVRMNEALNDDDAVGS